MKFSSPKAETTRSCKTMNSITQDRAKVKSIFAEYAPVLNEIQKKLTEDYRKIEVDNHH